MQSWTKSERPILKYTQSVSSEVVQSGSNSLFEEIRKTGKFTNTPSSINGSPIAQA